MFVVVAIQAECSVVVCGHYIPNKWVRLQLVSPVLITVFACRSVKVNLIYYCHRFKTIFQGVLRLIFTLTAVHWMYICNVLLEGNWFYWMFLYTVYYLRRIFTICISLITSTTEFIRSLPQNTVDQNHWKLYPNPVSFHVWLNKNVRGEKQFSSSCILFVSRTRPQLEFKPDRTKQVWSEKS